MKHFFLLSTVIFVFFSLNASAQIPTTTLLQIVKAEDERRFDQTLENLLANPNEKIRARAALAAGRIGDERAISALAKLLQTDVSTELRSMAAFALGETESAKAAPAIIEVLNNRNNPPQIRAFALEAAGKIAAANTKDEKYKELGEAILRALDFESKRRSASDREVVLFGLTAALRARPTDTEKVVVEFLGYSDARIRADALNTVARLRAKNANEKARELLQKDVDPIVRANAARVLGAAEDKDALDLLLKAATTDADSRVRVSSIRSLASLKDAKAADALLTRAEELLNSYSSFKMPPVNFPKEKNELLEIVTALGRILQNSNNERATKFLSRYGTWEYHQSSETEIARARISPVAYASEFDNTCKGEGSINCGDERPLPAKLYYDWQAISNVSQGLAEIASLDKNQNAQSVSFAQSALLSLVLKLSDSKFYRNLNEQFENFPEKDSRRMEKAIPDVMRSYAAFKTNDLPEILRNQLKHKDVTIRATAAGLLGEQAANKENIEALKSAFTQSLATDKLENDAQLAILSALVKLDKPQSYESLRLALKAPDFLVRRHAANLIRANDLTKDFSNIEKMVGTVNPYNTATKTKLGQVFNTNADYVRAVSRKNAKAIITTVKGAFTIEFFPEAAPLTVDNFIKLARAGYYNNLSIHRVVPNFVMQDGDPRGDGNGGPGWSIRCEINQIQYERGMVGMALSGKDTGGSQWFVTHSPQPHLDGGYTVFGKVNEADMKIVDNLVRGDKILSVKIVEGNTNIRSQRKK